MEKVSHKKKKAIIISVSVAVALIMVATLTLFIIAKLDKRIFYKIPKSEMPTSENYALTQYSYEDVQHMQTTIRSDVSNVIERNVERTLNGVLTNEYALVYDKGANTLTPQYGFEKNDTSGGFNKYDLKQNNGSYKISNDQIQAARIDFKVYPRAMTVGGQSAWSIGSGVGYTSEVGAWSGLDAASYTQLYKYMLFSQCYNITTEAATRSRATLNNAAKMEEYKKWLKKHPAADSQYGRVLGSDGKEVNYDKNSTGYNANNAVTKKITVDPIYRSLHATGLYLPAGEPIKIKIEGLKPGETIGLKMNEQDSCAWEAGASTAGFPSNYNQTKFTSGNDSDKYFRPGDMATAIGNVNGVGIHNHWSKAYGRLPWLRSMVGFSENGDYVYGSPLGGVIEVDMKNCHSKVTITISGAVETPHYILGQTTPEYFDKYLRQAPGVVAILDTENGQLIGPTMEMGTTKYMRQVKTEEIDKLAMLWHSFYSVNESFTGGVYNRFNKTMFDWLVPAGAAVSMGNYSFAHPTDWFDGVLNYRGLLQSGHWGPLHEIGHNHGNAYGTTWGFGGGHEGEVWNNALIVLSYIKLCDVGTTRRHGGDAEHGDYANSYLTLSETLRNTYPDWSNTTYFQALGMYANIMHSFGADKFYELLYTYKPSKTEPASYSENKRADFAYRCAITYKMNFLKYFNTFYGANITDEMFSAEQLAFMKTLPNYEPVANYYAGGIDGVKTNGDYKVNFGEDIKFNLLEKTISSLDTKEEKGFKIVSVSNPTHGKIKKLENGVYAYSFNKNYSGSTDEFSFKVQLKDNVIHTLHISLRISYDGGSRVTTYSGLNMDDKSWKGMQGSYETIMEQAKNITPTYENSNVAGVVNYNDKDWKLKVSDFYWKATKSGEVSFAIKGKSGLTFMVGDDFDSLVESKLFYSSGASYNHGFKKTVEKDKLYAIRVINVNRGGEGGAEIGIMNDSGGYSAIPQSQFYHPNYPFGKDTEKFIFEPKFLVSKKDNVNLSGGSEKSEWKIIQAPENVLGGRFEKKTQVDTETGEVKEVEPFDRWQYLIDGQAGTNMHTTYGGGVKKITSENPHVFVLDTNLKQSFNYFNVTTRNHSNSYITECELQISDSGEDGTYKTIASGTRDNYSAQTLSMEFSQVTGRYLKLIVKGTTGGNFSVLAELDAGIKSSQQIINPINSKLFITDGWKNSKDIDTEPNGYLISEKKDSKVVVKFVGTSFDIYAATGKDFGSAKVLVDGKEYETINTNSSISESRKLAISIENLKNKEHTVEIITTSANKVMLYAMGIPYSASLINAPNIYKERALAISLTVFVLLFLATTALVLALVFSPKFRNKVFGSKLINKLDNRQPRVKPEKPAKAKNEKTKEETRKLEMLEKEQNKKAPVVVANQKPAGKNVPQKVEPKKENLTAKKMEEVKKLSAKTTAPQKPQPSKVAQKAAPAAPKKVEKPAAKPATKPAAKGTSAKTVINNKK